MEMIINKCLRCGHEWIQRKVGGKPTNCPHCISPYWDRPRIRINVRKTVIDK